MKARKQRDLCQTYLKKVGIVFVRQGRTERLAEHTITNCVSGHVCRHSASLRPRGNSSGPALQPNHQQGGVAGLSLWAYPHFSEAVIASLDAEVNARGASFFVALKAKQF